MFLKNKYGLRNSFIPQTLSDKSKENKVEVIRMSIQNAVKLTHSITATLKYGLPLTRLTRFLKRMLSEKVYEVSYCI